MADLGRWLGGDYRVPGRPLNASSEAPPPGPEDETAEGA
jgi:endogenous inhibitor of DNA gyrase (YacG/DUF329 family)